MLVENGVEYWVADIHGHTNILAKNGIRSDGQKSPLEQFQNGRQAGLDLMGLADHDTEEAYYAVPDNARAKMLRIMEATTIQGHVLIDAPDDTLPFPSIPVFSTLEYAVKAAEQVNAKVYIPHPNHRYGRTRLASITPRSLKALYDKGLYVDGIEVMNPCLSASEEQLARELAKEYNLAKLAGSDDHYGAYFGRTFVTVFKKRTDDPKADFHEAIEQRTTQARRSAYKPHEEVSTLTNNVYHIATFFERLPRKILYVPNLVNGAVTIATERVKKTQQQIA